jgi:hypothetical protein
LLACTWEIDSTSASVNIAAIGSKARIETKYFFMIKLHQIRCFFPVNEPMTIRKRALIVIA